MVHYFVGLLIPYKVKIVTTTVTILDPKNRSLSPLCVNSNFSKNQNLILTFVVMVMNYHTHI